MTTLKLMASPNVGIIFHRNTFIYAICASSSRRDRTAAYPYSVHQSVAFTTIPTSTWFFSYSLFLSLRFASFLFATSFVVFNFFCLLLHFFGSQDNACAEYTEYRIHCKCWLEHDRIFDSMCRRNILGGRARTTRSSAICTNKITRAALLCSVACHKLLLQEHKINSLQ